MIVKFDSLAELLAFNIKYYRYLSNLSQESLAEKSGLSPRYFSDVERGVHSPPIPKIELIAKALQIEPYILFQNPKRDKEILQKMNTARQYNQMKQ